MISATIRDIAIIIIAVESIFVFLLLGVLVWQVWRLTKMLQTEIKPIIEDTKDTVSTVRGTAAFLSENVVTPVTKTSSNIVGMRRTLQVLTSGIFPSRKKSSSPPTEGGG